VALLEQWGVFDAETVVRTADPAVLDAALREISARFGEIKNPGAYLRRLLTAAAAPAPRQPQPAAVVPAAPVAAIAPVAARVPVPVDDEPAGRRLPEFTGEQLAAVYAGLSDGDRAEVDRALGRMADVAGAGWCHVPGLIRPRRLYLVGILERLGLLGDAVA
jgi:hypothetical protein